MATTYKQLNSPDPIVLTARAYADEVEIHAAHALRPCTSFQWKYDNLLGTPTSIVDALGTSTAQNYTVDLSSVASSGEYFCEITIGSTGDCDQVTERRRISIISCSQQTPRTFTATGAFGTFEVVAPHYETVVFNNEGNDWIVGGTLVGCPTPVETTCTFVQNFTLADQTSAANRARRGQPTLTVGTFVCFYNIAQDYIRTERDDGITADQADGPFITLAQDGPTTIGSNITVSATVGRIVDALGTVEALSDFTIVFRDLDAGTILDMGSGTATTRILNLTSRTVTATVTDNTTGLSATADIAVAFTEAEDVPTTIIGRSPINVRWTDPYTGSTRRERSLDFEIAGGGDFLVNVVLYPEGLNPPDRNETADEPRTALVTVFLESGPGFPTIEFEDELIIQGRLGIRAPTRIERNFEFEGTGSYRLRMTIAIYDGPQTQPIQTDEIITFDRSLSYAQLSVLPNDA